MLNLLQELLSFLDVKSTPVWGHSQSLNTNTELNLRDRVLGGVENKSLLLFLFIQVIGFARSV